MTGGTYSGNFPVSGLAVQANFAGGGTDAVIVKVGATSSGTVPWHPHAGVSFAAGLHILCHFPGLRRLVLCEATAGDDSLQVLAACTQLEECVLSCSLISSVGWQLLARLPRLRVLNLADQVLNDAAIGYLATSPTLRRLHLQLTDMTAVHVEGLMRLSKLEHLVVANALAEEDVVRLRAALPNCEVVAPHLQDRS